MAIVRYTHDSRIGQFSIALASNGRWVILLDGENLGSYHSPDQALEDLCGGHCDWPGTTDPSTLQLPNELGDWEARHTGRR